MSVPFIEAPSPNFDARKAVPDTVILHYTGMETGEAAIERLRDPEAKVSAHYCVEEDGRIFRLVAEERRAWHAGAAFWKGVKDINSASIGIEIVNAGFVDTPAGRVYAPFPQAQVDEVVALVRDIQQRHNVRPERIIGHADIAPGRKQDPGPSFPWKQLADAGLIPWPDANLLLVKRLEHEVAPRDVAWLQERLSRIGYNVSRSGQMDVLTKEVVATFQMKYRPRDISGTVDAETAARIDVASTPTAMRVAGATEGETRPYTSRW